MLHICAKHHTRYVHALSHVYTISYFLLSCLCNKPDLITSTLGVLVCHQNLFGTVLLITCYKLESGTLGGEI